MRENGMPFVADMIRAVIERRKLQTRRIVNIPAGCEYDGYDPNTFDVLCSSPTSPTGSVRVRNRYGVAGDRVWARETWTAWCTVGAGDMLRVKYAADNTERDIHLPGVEWRLPQSVQRGGNAPSMFMPRWASRITLELTRVRVERVRDITDEDARAEGVAWRRCEVCADRGRTMGGDLCAKCAGIPFDHPRQAFRRLWDGINRDRGFDWDANPIVRVYDFRIIEVGGRAVAA